MKRILAIILAMLLAFGAAALAEEAAAADNAAVMTLSNIEITMQDQKANLGDLALSLALAKIDDNPALVGMADGGSTPLLTAVMELTNEQILLAFDGLDCAFGEKLPDQVAGSVGQLAEAMPQIIAGLGNVALPAIPGLPIPKVDLSGLLMAFSTGEGTFEIPAETVTALVDLLADLIGDYGQMLPQLAQVGPIIDQVKQSGMSARIDGTIEDDGTTQTIVGDVYLVQGDQESESAVLRLTIVTADNSFVLTFGADAGSGLTDLARFALKSDPESAENSLVIDAMGQVNLELSTRPEDGLQKVALDFNTSGQEGGIEFGYGQQNGVDVVTLSANAGASVALVIETAMGEDGVRTGTLSLESSMEGQTVNATADITMYANGDIGMDGFTMPEDVRSFSELNAEAIQPVLLPLMEYLNSVTPEAA